MTNTLQSPAGTALLPPHWGRVGVGFVSFLRDLDAERSRSMRRNVFHEPQPEGRLSEANTVNATRAYESQKAKDPKTGKEVFFLGYKNSDGSWENITKTTKCTEALGWFDGALTVRMDQKAKSKVNTVRITDSILSQDSMLNPQLFPAFPFIPLTM